MKITCDPVKRASTMEARGLDMQRATEVFSGVHFTLQDQRSLYRESRYITVGTLDDRMVVLVWTQRGTARRIISMRKANAREQKKHARHLDRSR